MIRSNYYKYLEEYMRAAEKQMDQIILPSSMGINDPVLSALLSRIIELQQDIRLYTGPERDRNPIIQSKIEGITAIKKDIGEAVRTLESTDNIKLTFLKKQLEDTERQIGLLPASERQLISVQRNYSLLENLYVFLMQKLSEAEISEASNTSDIIPVNPAMRGGAISPKP